MKPDISEFSYGFALTAELIEFCPSARHAGAPEFPSLYSEGQSGGGYDVEIPGMALFLQFKLSEVLERPNAKEAVLIGLPYFRMNLRPLRHSPQHRLLLELESPERLVFYGAPGFSTPTALNIAYINRQTMERSAFFRPRDIGQLPDDRDHYVVFTDRSNEAYFCSDEPKRVSRTSGEDLVKSIQFQERLAGRMAGVDSGGARREFFARLIARMLEIYDKFGSKPHLAELAGLQARLDEPYLETHAQYLSQTLFGCELLVA